MKAAWVGWITMRGDDGAIDAILVNPNRRTRLHAFADGSQRAACGVRQPEEENHLGLIAEGQRCARCVRLVQS